jgi:hypothetical protein
MEQRLALGVKEAAEAVGLSHWTIRKFIREGSSLFFRVPIAMRSILRSKHFQRQTFFEFRHGLLVSCP